MKNIITFEARRFPVTIQKHDNGEICVDYVVLSKTQLNAAQLVGESSKELIHRIYNRAGADVLTIGKAEKRTVKVDMNDLWG